MILLYKSKREDSRYVRISVFTAPSEEYTFQNAGSFLLTHEEFALFRANNYETKLDLFDEI
jgi:1,2-phenylacetyl-CoA epoxidase PaaB subunit